MGRQAVLTGRNHHSVGMGGITEIATSAPGYSSVRPDTCAPLAETLMLNGYSTGQFGKCHEVPLGDQPDGPLPAVADRQRVRVLLRLHRRGDQPVPPGDRMEFAYDGGGLAKGGDVKLYVDGDEVGGGRVDATVPMLYSGDETCDVGEDTDTSVSDDYEPADSHFSGQVHWVQLDAGTDDHDHLITAEERLRSP